MSSTLLFGCGTTEMTTGTYYPEGDELAWANPLEGNYAKDKAIEKHENRKVVYNAYLKIFVEDPDTVNEQLADIAQKYGGYGLELGTLESAIRVKSDKLHAALDEISTLGNVKNRLIAGDDVTDQYTDYRIRLENAQKARDRYLQLLAKAENVEAALKVEKELERLNGEIDLLKGHLNQIKHKTEYSRINISLYRKVKPGLVGYVGIGLYHSVKWLFVRG